MIVGVVHVGADSNESQILRDAEDLITGLERELAAANRHRIALEARHRNAARVAAYGSYSERRLLSVLRTLAFIGALVLTVVIGMIWTESAVLGMAAIPLAPVVLLGIVLAAEHKIRRRHRMFPAYY